MYEVKNGKNYLYFTFVFKLNINNNATVGILLNIVKVSEKYL